MRYQDAVALLKGTDDTAVDPAMNGFVVDDTDVALSHDAKFERIVLSAVVLASGEADLGDDLALFLCRANLAFHGRGGQVLSRDADGTLLCRRSVALEGLSGTRLLEEIGATAVRSRRLGDTIRSKAYLEPAADLSFGDNVYLRA